MVPLSYAALFGVIFATGAGLPLPEDLAVVGGGVAVARGQLALVPTILVGVIAVVAGDLFLVALGRFARHRFAKRFPPARVAEAEASFARWGDLAIVMARFVVGARALLFFAAGALHRPIRRVILFDTLAACVQVPLLVLGGAAAADHLRVVGVALFVLVILALLWRRMRA